MRTPRNRVFTNFTIELAFGEMICIWLRKPWPGFPTRDVITKPVAQAFEACDLPELKVTGFSH
jgi:hypothetical protein